jgi:hypothetical protein
MWGKMDFTCNTKQRNARKYLEILYGCGRDLVCKLEDCLLATGERSEEVVGDFFPHTAVVRAVDLLAGDCDVVVAVGMGVHKENLLASGTVGGLAGDGATLHKLGIDLLVRLLAVHKNTPGILLRVPQCNVRECECTTVGATLLLESTAGLLLTPLNVLHDTSRTVNLLIILFHVSRAEPVQKMTKI